MNESSSPAASLAARTLRSPLGRARGLGSARSGLGAWWAMRVTSVALAPLTVWFVFTALHLSGLPRAGVARFVGAPVNATLLLALVLATFHHMQLGLREVIEDYMHKERAKVAAVLAVRGLCALLALGCVVAVLKLAFAA